MWSLVGREMMGITSLDSCGESLLRILWLKLGRRTTLFCVQKVQILDFETFFAR